MKIPEKIKAHGVVYKVKHPKDMYGGSFDCGEKVIEVGAKATTPMQILLHELLEMVFEHLGYRYENSNGVRVFQFDHDHGFIQASNDFYQILQDNNLLGP